MPTSLRLFASHDWGKDGLNHTRVREVVAGLREMGYIVWFDESDLKGNIMDAMCDGIDTCDVFLVFVTRNYVRKVQHGGDGDNCRREFMYAQRRVGTSRMVTIRFDSELPPDKWGGPVGMMLGERLYADLSINHTSSDRLRELARLFPTTTKTTSKAERSPVVLPPIQGVGYDKLTSAKGRVNRLMQEAGMSARENEHMHEKLVRLMASLGLKNDDGPFVAKLERVERQLGIVSPS